MRALVGQKDAGKKIFEKVFHQDILRLLSMEDLWKARQKPKPLVLKELLGKVDFGDRKSLQFDQRIWSLRENVAIFLETYETSLKLIK
jgi:ubiquitin-like 1-activating enzyme E1 B